MKKERRKHLFFCMAAGILMLIADTTIVYGAQQEEIEAVKEAQEHLQEEQRAHNEAIARQNREAVEAAVAEKVAEQYAAMGLVPPQMNVQGETQSLPETQAGIAAKEVILPEELWENLTSGNGDFSALYENMAEEQEKGEIPADTLSALLGSLTISDQPVKDITFEEIRELFPINNFTYISKAPIAAGDIKGIVRYDDELGFFTFSYFWQTLLKRETVLSVKYDDIDEDGNFTKIVFNTAREESPLFYRDRDYDSFQRVVGYNKLPAYNLGCEGLSSYLLDNKCLHVWNLMQLVGVEIDILDEEENPKTGILCRSFTTEYGDVTAFYYRNPATQGEYFALNFEDNDTYDYILAEGETGGAVRIEIKLK